MLGRKHARARDPICSWLSAERAPTLAHVLQRSRGPCGRPQPHCDPPGPFRNVGKGSFGRSP